MCDLEIRTLAEWQRARGMSGYAVVKDAGISSQTWHRLTRTGGNISDGNRRRIADALGVTVMQVSEFRRAILGE